MVVYDDIAAEFGDLGAPVEDNGFSFDGERGALEVDAAGDGGGFVATGDVDGVAGEEDIALGDGYAALAPDFERDDADLRVLGADLAVAGLDVDVAVEDIAAGVDVKIVGIGRNDRISENRCGQ